MRRADAGFTLAEMMIVIVIIGILAAIIIPNIVGKTDRARVTAARADVTRVAEEVQMFYSDQGRWPDTLRDLAVRPPWAKTWPKGGYCASIPRDPWGRELVLEVPGPGDRPFELLSLGADGQKGGEGVNEDIRYWPPEE